MVQVIFVYRDRLPRAQVNRFQNEPGVGRGLFLRILSLAIGAALAIVALELVLRALPVFSGMAPAAVNAAQPVLHFVPDVEFTYSRGWNLRGVNRGRINNVGFVNDQDYTPEQVPPIVAVIGDSYVEAAMIPYGQTFHGQLAAMLGDRARVYSFGMSGAALSQYLVWAKYVGDTFRPTVLVISIIANDFDESLLRYKDAVGFHYFDDTDPDMPLIRIDYEPHWLRLRRSSLYRYVRHNLNAVDAVRNILSPPSTMQFIGNVPATVEEDRLRRSRVVVRTFLDRLGVAASLEPHDIVFVVDGLRPSLYREDELSRAAGSYWQEMRRYFTEEATRRGYEVIDMQPAFIARHRQTGEMFEFPDDGHWNETGHTMVAAAIGASSALRRTVQLQVPDTVDKAKAD